MLRVIMKNCMKRRRSSCAIVCLYSVLGLTSAVYDGAGVRPAISSSSLHCGWAGSWQAPWLLRSDQALARSLVSLQHNKKGANSDRKSIISRNFDEFKKLY